GPMRETRPASILDVVLAKKLTGLAAASIPLMAHGAVATAQIKTVPVEAGVGVSAHASPMAPLLSFDQTMSSYFGSKENGLEQVFKPKISPMLLVQSAAAVDAADLTARKLVREAISRSAEEFWVLYPGGRDSRPSAAAGHGQMILAEKYFLLGAFAQRFL